VQGATVRFGSFTAVNGASFSVRAGEVFGLLGPNGSGKTTLIRALCGLVRLDGGGATVLGHDVVRGAASVRREVGYTWQRCALYGDRSARENIASYAGVYGLSPVETRAREAELVELTNLGPYLSRRADRLSGGWKQRLALVCALMHRPKLVFLDEP